MLEHADSSWTLLLLSGLGFAPQYINFHFLSWAQALDTSPVGTFKTGSRPRCYIHQRVNLWKINLLKVNFSKKSIC